MNLSFAPLAPDAKYQLSISTGVDFTLIEDMRTWCCATARNQHDGIMGVLACEPLNGFDWRFNCAIWDQRCMSPRLLRTIFVTLFKFAARVSAHIDPENDPAIEQAKRLGFTYEGFLRRGLDGRRDALLYGMLPEECIWLVPTKYHAALRRQGVTHGLQPQAS